jgi:hypothetical protein
MCLVPNVDAINVYYNIKINKRQRKPTGQSRMADAEKLATPGTQETGQRQKKQQKQPQHNTEKEYHISRGQGKYDTLG